MSFLHFIIGIISRSLDLLPLTLKWKFCSLFPSRICNSLIRHGSSRSIKWIIPEGSFKLQVSPGDDFFGMYLRGVLESWESEALNYWYQHSRGADTVVDVGSYIGAYSLIAASGAGASRVISFEPNLEGWKASNLNAKKNSLDSKIQVFPVALGKNNAIVPLIAPKGRNFSSSAMLSTESVVIQDDWEVVNYVTCKPLDHILDFADTKSISLIKIDTEGSEIDVLMGASNILRVHHPRLIVECLASGAYEVIQNYLDNFGYKVGTPLDGCHFNCLTCPEDSCEYKARNFAFY
jgi:FkbM family methyltransferase